MLTVTGVASCGVDAEATRQAKRGQQRSYPTLKRIKAQERGALPPQGSTAKSGDRFMRNHKLALESWVRIMAAMTRSTEPADRKLGGAIRQYIEQMPFAIELHEASPALALP